MKNKMINKAKQKFDFAEIYLLSREQLNKKEDQKALADKERKRQVFDSQKMSQDEEAQNKELIHYKLEVCSDLIKQKQQKEKNEFDREANEAAQIIIKELITERDAKVEKLRQLKEIASKALHSTNESFANSPVKQPTKQVSSPSSAKNTSCRDSDRDPSIFNDPGSEPSSGAKQ